MSDKLIGGLIFYLLFLITLCIHEWAHGAVAYICGDKTPKIYGRLTLNPIAHIDKFGTVIIPLAMILLSPGFVIFGWAKPVPIDSRNFKRKNIDDIIVSLAGPFANFALAFGSAILGGACAKYFTSSIASLFGSFMLVNICLGIFNLIPLPPLNGSHILKRIINMSDETFIRLSQYSFWILLLLINIPAFSRMFGTIILFVFSCAVSIASSLFGINPMLFLPM